MRCSLRALGGRVLVFLTLFQCVLASRGDRVQTEAQAGPLYRVEGSQLSISCSVSGLPPLPDDRNNFEFRVKKPSKPNFSSHIISTIDSDFSYAIYAQRVKTGEIIVEYNDPNSVVFKILSLEKADDGEYECAVINTRSIYWGTYNAMTTVKVIDNSLSVSSSAPAALTQTEGDSLDLTCEVSSNTVQHTHLSFAWFLRRNTEADSRPLISLDKDFRLIPGQGFEQRYKAGFISLNKIGEVTYKLKISHLELSDQGALYCEAQEWIQDPDRTWYSIVTKAAGETDLTVKPKEVLSDSVSLVVAVSVPQSILQEGQQLTVSCTVDTQNPNKKFFSLAWLRGGVELARVGPTGVLTVGPDYSNREREGELRAARIGERDYSLILQPVRMSDQGVYVCRAWPEEQSGSGDFTQGAYQDSAPQNITITATESGLSVEIPDDVSVKEGNKLDLFCRVSGITRQLSVTWQRQSASNAPFLALIRLDQDGVMTKAEGSLDVSVTALHPSPDLFTLELEEVTQTDAGVYQCVVSEWKTSNNKTSSQVATSTVTVTPLDSFVSVSLFGRNNEAAEGQEVELICRVRRLSLPRTLTWSVRRNSTTPESILTLYSSGVISWFGDQQQRYQLKIEKKNPQQNEMWYHMIIKSASKSEAGKYQCSVSVDLQKTLRKLRPSNELAVAVQSPESDLILTSAPSIRANINADIEIKCSVSSNSLMLSRYAVTWLLEQQTEKRTIVQSDQDAFITFGPEVEPGQRQRLSVSRTEGPNFILTIRNVHSSDRGVYTCEVVQWQLDPIQNWHKFPPVSKSIEMRIIEPASELHLNTTASVLNVKKDDNVELECNLISAVNSPSFFYKVIWLYSEHNASSNVPLVELDHTGLLTYPMDSEVQGVQQRVRLERPTQSSFHLDIHTVHEEDSGMYVCRVELYQLDRDGKWLQKAFNETSPVSLHVNVTGGVEAASEPQCNSPTWIGAFFGVTFLLLLVILLLVLRICRGNNPGKKKEASLWTENHQLNPKE